MPSEKILEQKKLVVDSLADKMQKAVAGVMVDYRGLTVEEDTKLRNELRAAGIEYAVVKNTLTRFAANRIGYTEFDEVLNGPTALALSYDDVVAPARVLADFAEKNSNLEIKAGFMEGKAMSVDEVVALSKIPSKDTLYAMLAGGLNSVIAGLARAIDAVREQKETA
ncbi:MAG: 50S ribosomal protein L10 [Clostridia bacterium]|nr:50S ribosomal protein L10 [Clostridia bacterium]